MAKENGKRTKNNTLQLFPASVALLLTLLLAARESSWMQSGGEFCFISDMLCKFL